MNDIENATCSRPIYGCFAPCFGISRIIVNIASLIDRCLIFGKPSVEQCTWQVDANLTVETARSCAVMSILPYGINVYILYEQVV